MEIELPESWVRVLLADKTFKKASDLRSGDQVVVCDGKLVTEFDVFPIPCFPVADDDDPFIGLERK